MAGETTLYLLCGKIASGKSTLARRLGEAHGAVVIHEDDWLAGLYSDQMRSIADYVRCAGKLRAMIGPHVVDLLNAGTSVVLDFPGNTPEYRAWMRELIDAAGVRHEMHVLDEPDELCWARLEARNASGEHPFQVTRAQFERITAVFSVPGEGEGFHLIEHYCDGD